MRILAIDPGPARSGWLVYDTDSREVIDSAVEANQQVLMLCRLGSVCYIGHPAGPAAIRVGVIEKVEGFGMAVGAEVFETVYWSGRFAEALRHLRVDRIGRRAIKLHLCATARAKDTNVRQALIDRFGGSGAKGTKKAPGPLYGIAGDLWSALALAVTWADLRPGAA